MPCGKASYEGKLRNDVRMASQRHSISVPRTTSVWKDPRLVAGVILLIVSIIACSQLITSARAGISLYQTTRPIAQGESLGPTNTRVVDVRPESEAYVLEGELPSGARSLVNLGPGELIARSAVTTTAQEDQRTLVISVSDGLPDSVAPGTTLELWFVPTPQIGSQEKQSPQLITGKATLVKVLGDSGILAGQGASRIEVRLSASDISGILESAHGNGTLSAVPVGL